MVLKNVMEKNKGTWHSIDQSIVVFNINMFKTFEYIYFWSQEDKHLLDFHIENVKFYFQLLSRCYGETLYFASQANDKFNLKEFEDELEGIFNSLSAEKLEYHEIPILISNWITLIGTDNETKNITSTTQRMGIMMFIMSQLYNLNLEQVNALMEA